MIKTLCMWANGILIFPDTVRHWQLYIIKQQKILTGIFSVFPRAVIKLAQKPSTPTGRWVGDIAMVTLKRTSEILSTLQMMTNFMSQFLWNDCRVRDQKDQKLKLKLSTNPIWMIGSNETDLVWLSNILEILACWMRAWRRQMIGSWMLIRKAVFSGP